MAGGLVLKQKDNGVKQNKGAHKHTRTHSHAQQIKACATAHIPNHTLTHTQPRNHNSFSPLTHMHTHTFVTFAQYSNETRNAGATTESAGPSRSPYQFHINRRRCHQRRVCQYAVNVQSAHLIHSVNDNVHELYQYRCARRRRRHRRSHVHRERSARTAAAREHRLHAVIERPQCDAHSESHIAIPRTRHWMCVVRRYEYVQRHRGLLTEAVGHRRARRGGGGAARSARTETPLLRHRHCRVTEATARNRRQ